jgi:hypothetical protein
MKMPFGKFKGCPVHSLPEDYLSWLWENIELREPLRSAVADALEGQEPHFLPEPSTVKGIYRRLAMKWHPDHGGSTEAMQAINEFYELLAERA